MKRPRVTNPLQESMWTGQPRPLSPHTPTADAAERPMIWIWVTLGHTRPVNYDAAFSQIERRWLGIKFCQL